MNNSLPV